MRTHIRAQKNNNTFRFVLDTNIVKMLIEDGLESNDILEIDIIKKVNKKNILGNNNES